MGKAEAKFSNTAKKMDKALLALIARKPFEAITVTDVCTEAHVHRSTFYAHYANTTELLDEIRHGLVEEFLASFGHIPEDEDVLGKEYLKVYLSFMEENKDVFGIMIGNRSLFNLSQIFEEFQGSFSRAFFISEHPGDRIARYRMRYIAAGITSIVSMWLASDCAESKDEIINIITDCVSSKR